MKSADLEADGQMDAPPGFTSSALLTSTLSRWDRLGQDAGPERVWGSAAGTRVGGATAAEDGQMTSSE